MAIYFPAELATSVFKDGDYIVIRQWADASENPNEVAGEVRLTKHQFDQMFNHQKHLDIDADA